jgi:hypothetical protein
MTEALRKRPDLNIVAEKGLLVIPGSQSIGHRSTAQAE